jgi:glucose/arabinose dehydrogenase
MLSTLLLALLALLTVLSAIALPAAADEPMKPHRLHVPSREGDLDATLWVRDGFSVSVFAAVPGTLRVIVQAPTGEMVVSELWEGRVLVLRDTDGDGFAEDVTPLLTGLTVSHGLAFAGNALYVAETNKVLRLDPWNDPSTAQQIITLPAGADIPGNPNHQTRSLLVGPDNMLYVSIGSYCDACAETDPMRGAIWRYNLDGTGGELFASGLRNAVGMTSEPSTNRIWVAEMGSNNLGPNLPPDELNVLGPAGSDYGWPYCYGSRTVQPPLGSPERCANTVPSIMDLPAHVAPLGLVFVSGSNFPAEYQGDLILAQHGSALLEDPIGYKVVRIPVRNGQVQPPEELVRGWLRGKGAWGRPVTPLFGQDGSLYLTDDKTGVVYRIRSQ